MNNLYEGGEKGMEFKIENGVLLKYEGSEKEITIPDGVESIARGAFSNCKTLQG